MKKVLATILVLSMVLSLALAGCTSSTPQTSETNSPAPSASESVTEPSASAETSAPAVTVKTGLGTVISIAKSKSVTPDADALTEADITTAAVTLGADGKIINVKIDMVQSKISFDANGQLKTDTTAALQTKVEQGDAYGMKAASKIGKEWYEQIAALEDWMVGKTIDEVMGMQISQEGTSAEADLTSSVTIHVGDYLNAVKKAVDNAKDFGVQVTGATKTGLGHVVAIGKSASAAADAEALAQTDDVAAAVTVDESGKIVGVVIDMAQVKINVDAKGNVTTDTTVAPQTKVELGDKYGMKSASKIGKEWYEQIAALSQWMIGKTIDEVMGMQLSAEGTTAEADLTSSVSVHVGDYLNAVQKAVNNAD